MKCAALIGLCVLAGCGVVRPTAESLAMFAQTRPELVSPAVLRHYGFDKIDQMGGPQLSSGECYEKIAIGFLVGLSGFDIVRVCFDEVGPIVMARQTHGCPWHEVYPNANELCWDEKNFSDETIVRLQR